MKVFLWAIGVLFVRKNLNNQPFLITGSRTVLRSRPGSTPGTFPAQIPASSRYDRVKENPIERLSLQSSSVSTSQICSHQDKPEVQSGSLKCGHEPPLGGVGRAFFGWKRVHRVFTEFQRPIHFSFGLAESI